MALKTSANGYYLIPTHQYTTSKNGSFEFMGNIYSMCVYHIKNKNNNVVVFFDEKRSVLSFNKKIIRLPTVFLGGKTHYTSELNGRRYSCTIQKPSDTQYLPAVAHQRIAHHSNIVELCRSLFATFSTNQLKLPTRILRRIPGQSTEEQEADRKQKQNHLSHFPISGPPELS